MLENLSEYLNVTVSDTIQLLSVSVAILVGLFALIVSTLSIIQTKKIYENEQRPYLFFSIKVTKNGKYLVLKNFGNKPGYVSNIKYDIDIKDLIPIDIIKAEYSKNPNIPIAPFSLNLEFPIAPGQSIGGLIQFEIDLLEEKNGVTVDYTDDYGKKYSYSYKIISTGLKNGMANLLVNGEDFEIIHDN